MSDAKLHELRGIVKPPGAKQRPLSAVECYSAWIWRLISRARQLEPGIKTVFNTPINVRPRVSPPLHPMHTGNALVYGRAEANVSNLFSSGLYDLGCEIRDNVSWWTDERV